jgi:branched-chain amino acid transport system permease protein
MVAMYYGLVNYFIGYIAGIKAFTAAVLGGIGSIRGAMFGGILLGLVESLGGSYISSEYKDAYAFILLIIVLIVKPGGLSARQNWKIVKAMSDPKPHVTGLKERL